MEFALEKELMMIGRLLIAGLCGGVIGHERENRRKPAGVRTHTVVGVASALMMLISKYGFNDVLNEYTKLDPSRVAAGVVTAIGFLGSGMIIARNKSVSGITTSAGIWATVGVGLAVGSGMIYLGIATSVIVVLVEMFLGRGGIMGLHREAMSAGKWDFISAASNFPKRKRESSRQALSLVFQNRRILRSCWN